MATTYYVPLPTGLFSHIRYFKLSLTSYEESVVIPTPQQMVKDSGTRLPGSKSWLQLWNLGQVTLPFCASVSSSVNGEK